MDAPEFPGAYFDGEDATRRPVRVRAAGGALYLRREDGGEVCWPRRSYRLVQGRYVGEPLRFERGLEALVVEDHGLLAALGRRSWPFVPVALGSAAVVGLSLLVFYFFALPALCASVARHIPRSWEEQL